MKLITVETLADLVRRHGFEQYLQDLIMALRRDFGRWHEFTKMPRPTMHVPGGVIELMPICDKVFYGFKYVNGHPKNPLEGKMTITATGQLARVDTGYPVMVSEMTLLTALRTAANSALATDLMARADSRVLAVIGTGAQSEFQVRAARLVRDIQEVRYFDIDARAMDKFERNMAGSGVTLTRCGGVEEAMMGADIVTVCTACKAHVDVVKNAWVRPGMHINALGGDCPGKTELELEILGRSRIVVEYLEQSRIEGEIQCLSAGEVKRLVKAELHEVVTGAKAGREREDEVTVYDSVGIALEDYAALRLTYELAERYGLGQEVGLVPELDDPKDLISAMVLPGS